MEVLEKQIQKCSPLLYNNELIKVLEGVRCLR